MESEHIDGVIWCLWGNKFESTQTIFFGEVLFPSEKLRNFASLSPPEYKEIYDQT
jgi:hypothetical protein